MVRSFRRILAYACAVGLLSAAGCDSVVDSSRVPEATPRLRARKPAPPRPQPPKFVAQTPVYPAPVIYILYREYLHKNPGLTSLSPEDPKYQRYLERRLRQLYPTKGYEQQGSNTHPAHEMDYHNNKIGYDVKYHTFRGRWWDDMWNRTAWANRVRAYVDHQANGVFANGEFISEWSSNPASISAASADARESSVPAGKYIYFAH